MIPCVLLSIVIDCGLCNTSECKANKTPNVAGTELAQKLARPRQTKRIACVLTAQQTLPPHLHNVIPKQPRRSLPLPYSTPPLVAKTSLLYLSVTGLTGFGCDFDCANSISHRKLHFVIGAISGTSQQHPICGTQASRM
jgi:hypothetical protein